MENTKTIDIGTFIIMFFGFRFAIYGNTGAAIMAVLVLLIIISNKRLRILSRHYRIKIIKMKGECNSCRFRPTKFHINGAK